MSDHSSLGDRIKGYEQDWENRLMPLVPAVVRFDGRAFHSFSRGLHRPYDKRLSDLMIETTKQMVRISGACIGYTQSDEITLVILVDDPKSEMFFGGRVQKMTSILPSQLSVFFNYAMNEYLPEKAGSFPVFDCRVFSVPNKTEASNVLVWREMDATRNSVSMAAQSVYSHKQLLNKSCNEMQEMLFQKGINWSNYPSFFKRGTYVQKRKVSRYFTTEEMESLPPKHEARTNPELKVLRTDYVILDMPPITKVINREKVIFDGEEPQTKEIEAK